MARRLEDPPSEQTPTKRTKLELDHDKEIQFRHLVRAKLEAKKAQLRAEKAQSEVKVLQLKAKKAQLEVKKGQLEAEKAQLEAKNTQFEADKIARDTAEGMKLVLNKDIQFGYDRMSTKMIVTNDGLVAENNDKSISLGEGIGARPLKGQAEFEVKIVSQNNWCVNLVLQWVKDDSWR